MSTFAFFTQNHQWTAFAFAFAAACLLSSLFVRFHRLHSIGSRSDKRRHNERSVPLIGGGAIATGFLAGCAYLHFSGGSVGGPRFLYVLGAVAVALLTGLLDDAYELRARWKLFGQNAVAGLLLLSLQGIETTPVRLLGQNAASLGLEWFWCLGILNSMNLIDGLDELSSGIAMIVLGFFYWAGAGSELFREPLFYAGLPAILGFYVWNRHPAKIYLGESGAQLAGIFLFLGSMTFRHSSSAAVDTVSVFFALGVPILDTLLAIIRRMGRKTGMMTPDREHLHHRLGRLGLSHPNISRFLHLLALYLCGLAYAYSRLESFSLLALALTGLGLNLFLLTLAERKLYFYLANFASHMLRMLDTNGHNPGSILARRRDLENDGIPHSVFRLDLSYCVGNLLEKSPGRIQTFYEKLGDSLRGESNLREVHFENSRTAIIIQPQPLGASADRGEIQLRADLAHFETLEHIDLGLHLQGSLSTMPERIELPSVAPLKPAAA